MANALALRLRRLEAIRTAAGRLFELPQLGHEVFDRGDPEPIDEIKRPEWTATLYDLLSVYASQRQRQALAHVRFKKRTVWSLAEAREAIQKLLGSSPDWTAIDQYLIAYVVDPAHRATVFASSLAATLEMVREGLIDIHQHAAFAPIYIRKRTGEGAGAPLPQGGNATGETKQ
jgi:segregation and condensation protein A